MTVRMWIGPVGADLLGLDSEGTPLLGDVEGVEPMTEVGGVLDFWPIAAEEA